MAVRSIVFFLVAAAGVAGAQASLRGDRVSREFIENQLQTELEALLGHGDSHERLRRVEALMQPYFGALPKTADGGLDRASARYALQRYFVLQHGWHIKGLGAARETSDESSTDVVKSKMPNVVLDAFERRLQGKSMRLPDLAVLAATIEDLVHSDTIDMLTDIYEIAGLPIDEPFKIQKDSDLVLDGYLMLYILPSIRRHLNSTALLRRLVKKAPAMYFGWEDLKIWINDLQGSLNHQERTERSPFDAEPFSHSAFSSMAHLVGAVNEGFGRFQDMECKAMKSSLLDLEDDRRADGRVQLSKFYSAYLTDRSEQFAESPEYLRHLGALDETDPSRPSVIVSNYMYAPTNCLATSNFISVCCINQCDSLMASLEADVAQPTASPEQLAQLVSQLPSETVAAPRVLAQPLRNRLDEIAARHGGIVPLHGRLFAQFMHHAFPNECQYPHLSSTMEKPLTVEEWNAKHSKGAHKASEAVMRSTVESAAAASENGTDIEEPAVPWLHEEELLSESLREHVGSSKRGSSVLRSVLRAAAFAGVVGASAVALTGHVKQIVFPDSRHQLPSWSSTPERGSGKAHFV